MTDTRLTKRAASDDARPAALDRDAVHDAAMDSFPASDAPSWSPLRAGPPAHAAPRLARD